MGAKRVQVYWGLGGLQLEAYGRRLENRNASGRARSADRVVSALDWL